MQSLMQKLEHIVSENGGQRAVTDEECALSYLDLHRKSQHLCDELRSYGFEAGSIIPVLATRSIEYILLLVATVKLGATYVPIDPVNPAERVRIILDTLGCTYVFGVGVLNDPFNDPSIIFLEITKNCKIENGGKRLQRSAIASGYGDLAIVFTSGTTGLPKGVRLTSEGVCCLVDSVSRIVTSNCNQYLHHSSVGFDAALFEIWVPLLTGATLTLNPKPFDVDRLDFLLQETSCDVLLLTTSLFHLVVMHRPHIFSQVKFLFVGGEALKPDLASKVLRTHPSLTLINGYGPTENTVFSTFYKMTANDLIGNEAIPIGFPLDGVIVRVVDRDLRLVVQGTVGELLLGGRNLSAGYLDAVQTAKSFVCFEGETFYRTGDEVIEQEGGILHYRGRMDAQVKIKGYRVEITEIERVLAGMPGLKQCAVIAESMNEIEKRLVSFLVMDSPEKIVGLSEVQEFLRPLLPHYMIPSYNVIIETFPVTQNGKLNRQALQSLIEDERVYKVSNKISINSRSDKVMAILSDILGEPNLAPHDSIYTLGASSLSIAMAQSALDAEFKKTSSFENIASLDLVDSWIEYYSV